MTFTATRSPKKIPRAADLRSVPEGCFVRGDGGIYRLSTFIRLRKATVLWISLYITTSSLMKGTSLR